MSTKQSNLNEESRTHTLVTEKSTQVCVCLIAHSLRCHIHVDAYTNTRWYRYFYTQNTTALRSCLCCSDDSHPHNNNKDNTSIWSVVRMHVFSWLSNCVQCLSPVHTSHIRNQYLNNSYASRIEFKIVPRHRSFNTIFFFVETNHLFYPLIDRWEEFVYICPKIIFNSIDYDYNCVLNRLRWIYRFCGHISVCDCQTDECCVFVFRNKSAAYSILFHSSLHKKVTSISNTCTADFFFRSFEQQMCAHFFFFFK